MALISEMKIRKLPDLDILNHYFHYSHETGELKWKNPSSKKTRTGNIAGSKGSDGYIVVNLHKIHYPVHRIIWKMTTKSDPERLIDHINGDRSDNRIENLREAEFWQNLCNRGKNKNNTSGIKNICFDKNKGLWFGSLGKKGKVVFRKYSKNILVVEKAIDEARKLHHLDFSKK